MDEVALCMVSLSQPDKTVCLAHTSPPDQRSLGTTKPSPDREGSGQVSIYLGPGSTRRDYRFDRDTLSLATGQKNSGA